MDPNQLSFLLESEHQGVFADYLETVANRGLTRYKSTFQYGNKHGESLWTHINDMICVFESIQPLLSLDDLECRVLYAAVIVHDINKMRDEKQSYSKLATEPLIREVIEEIGFDEFFPEWGTYLSDIEALIRAHSGHYSVAGDSLIPKLTSPKLGRARINALVYLLRALDAIDLSHTLDELTHKDACLSALNTYLNESGDPCQLKWYTHQVVEQRGLLTNVIHNAIIDALSVGFDLTPVLLYPDGVAYLAEESIDIALDPKWLGRHIASQVNGLVAGKPTQLIDFKPNSGYKIKSEAFELGVPFARIWLAIRNEISGRKFTPERYDSDVRPGAIRAIKKAQKKQPDYGVEWLKRLQDPDPLITNNDDQLRASELARAYRLFIDIHMKRQLKCDPWHYVYELLELPPEKWAFYDCFNSSSHRHLVIAGDIAFSEDELFDLCLSDAKCLLSEAGFDGEGGIDLWVQYTRRYVLFDGSPVSGDGWQDHLVHYVANQHHQCAHCSDPFDTDDWMSADVRDGIKVQQFSYRLLGGSSREPKKYICSVCKTQFLLEKLTYPRVRGESLLYLHLYPYSFYPASFMNAFNATVNRLRGSDFAVHALNMNTAGAVDALVSDVSVLPDFRAMTKQGKPQPYGIYIPLFSEASAGQLIFPINAAGENDTERFLFALWFALVLQRHFGVRVVMSESAVPPVDLQALPDLYLDNIPLGCSGFLQYNDYNIFGADQRSPGSLQQLWREVKHLFALDQMIFKDDVKIAVVRSMLDGPLGVFHVMDRLLEKHDRQFAGRDAFPHICDLALSTGGDWMDVLSKRLTTIAELAWQNRIRGQTLKRSSLLYPLNEVFVKMKQVGGMLDRETLIAATTEDIFEHLKRIADENYTPGKTKRQAVEEYVRLWYDSVLDGVYGGDVQRLVADEKLLRSAYLFFVQAQIPQRAENNNNEEGV